MKDKIEKLNKLINSSKFIVFFGGAGVSTESGLKDFRSVDGIYNENYKYPPETILSHSFFVKYPQEFYRFYFDKMISLDAKPNKAHKKLAQLEEVGILKAVITQNIDGLHQLAQSKKVLELHGSVWRNYCTRCNAFFKLKEILPYKDGIPQCKCGGIIKPDVVLYEEGLDSEILQEAVEFLQKADLVIVGGTSLNVYPAAGLLRYTHAPIVVINRDSTPYDDKAELVVSGNIGEVLDLIELS